MCSIEKITTENQFQVSVGSVYAVDLGHNRIYHHMTVTHISLDTITGNLWATGANAHLVDLPHRIPAHPKLLLKTRIPFTVKHHQILKAVEIVTREEFDTISEDLRQNIFFASHSKDERNFKKISRAELNSKISPTRQLGVIIRRGITKIIRRKANYKGSFPIDTQTPLEAIRQLRTSGATSESKKFITINITKRRTMDQICGAEWDSWKIPGDVKHQFLSTLVVRYHKERRTIQLNTKYFRPIAPYTPDYRHHCFTYEIIGRQHENYEE